MFEVFAPHLNHNVKIGGRKLVPHKTRMNLRHYVNKRDMPVPPASCDFSAPALTVLRDPMENDILSNCVIVAGYHYVGVVTGNAGNVFHATRAQVIADYSAIGGYIPGDSSTDQGSDPHVACDYWISSGFANGTKAKAHLALDPSNPTEIMQAISIFEGAMLGGPLADEWFNPFPSGDGFVWTPGHYNMQAGHEVETHGYDASGLKIATWGLLGTMTWAAVAGFADPSRGGDLYLILTPDLIAKGKTNAPNGLNWSQLIQDFDALGGDVPVPVPVTPPVKIPTMKLVPGVPGELIIDTYAVIRPDTAVKLWATGVRGSVRYLDNVTVKEMNDIWAVCPQWKFGFVSSCRRTGWVPIKTMGTADGQAAVAKLKSLGIVVGPHAQADCEGMGGTGQGLIDYLDARGSVIKAAAYRHAEYEGWGHKSNPYASLQTNGYWAALAIAEPRPACGWFMVQLMPGNQTRCGLVVDLNVVQQDQRGRVPYFVAAA